MPMDNSFYQLYCKKKMQPILKSIVAQGVILSTLFQAKQLLFYIQPTAVTHKRTVRSDYTVAGYKYRNRVPVVRHTHRPVSAGAPCHFRNLLITARFAVRNGQKAFPNSFLKFCPFGRKWQGKFPACSREILLKLAERFPVQLRFRNSSRIVRQSPGQKASVIPVSLQPIPMFPISIS